VRGAAFEGKKLQKKILMFLLNETFANVHLFSFVGFGGGLNGNFWQTVSCKFVPCRIFFYVFFRLKC
jgi:hypothetical protein